MSAITSVNVANAIVKLVAVDALPALMGNLVMGNLVNRDYDPTLAQTGDTVNVPIRPALVPNNILEWGCAQAQIVLNTHAEATFQIPDVTKILTVPDLLKLYMQPAMVALAEKMESDLLSLCPLFTANTILGAPGAAMTEAVVDSAETALFKARVPAISAKYLVVDATSYSNMRKLPRFTEFYTGHTHIEAAGSAGIRALVDGKIKDFFVFRSQFVPKTGSAPSTTHNLAFTKDAIGLVMRRLPLPLPGWGAIAEYAEMGDLGMRVVMSYQPNTLAQQFTVDVLYGVGVLRNNFAVQINT